MTEISKQNLDIPKIGMQEIKKEQPVAQDTAKVAEDKKEIKDFANPSAEALGRSQVSVAKADSVENDMKLMQENPKLVAKANAMCDAAQKLMEKEGIEHPYEKATQVMDVYKNEMQDVKA